MQSERDPFFSPTDPTPGPPFRAGYDGECSNCGWEIEAGDMIRADGHGGYEHTDCEG